MWHQTQTRLYENSLVLTIEQLDQSRDDARLGQHGRTRVADGHGADQDHHLQDQVVLGRTWRRWKREQAAEYDAMLILNEIQCLFNNQVINEFDIYIYVYI